MIKKIDKAMDRKKGKVHFAMDCKKLRIYHKELTAEDTFDANSTILQHDASSNKYSLGGSMLKNTVEHSNHICPCSHEALTAWPDRGDKLMKNNSEIQS